VHMSWNGATGIASWRVLAGAKPGALAPRATVASSGFETEAILPAKWAYVAVRPLDAAGHELGASEPVAVTSYQSSFP
jgi:hypothetical protein